jgi:hypothetical protein
MPFGANMYYSDPTIGRIGSNLATAIYGDPEARLKRGLYDAQAGLYGAETEKNRAEAGKLTEETRAQKGLNDAQDSLGDAIAGFSAPLPGEAPQDTMNRNAPAVAKFMRAHKGNTQEAATALGNIWSSILSQGDPDQQRRSLVGQGKMPDQNFSPTGAIADQNAGRNADLQAGVEVAKQQQADRGSMGRTIYQQGQENSRNAATIAGENYRAANAPITVAPNATAFLPKTNPNFAQFGDRIYGRTDTTAKTPSEVSAKDLEDVIFSAASQIPGATMPDPTRPGNTIINPGFEANFPPDKVIQARSAAASVYQTTRNAQQAVGTYMQALGIAPGSSFTPAKTGWFNSAPSAIVPPVGRASQAPAGDPIADARTAIAKGAPRAAVIQRLQQAKIPVPPDL